MRVEFLKLSEEYLEARLSGCSEAMVNAIRRTILEEVPVLAINEVYIFENPGPMFDEILSHRLGLIPLKTPINKYLPMDSPECTGGSGERCFTTLSLDVSAGEEPLTVYAKDLTCKDAEVYPVYGNIPITKIPPRSRLRLEAIARMGRGKMHAKWQPASLATYSFTEQPDVFIFKLESTGSLPSLEILKQALKILRDKFKTLMDSFTLPEVEEQSREKGVANSGEVG
ncbi:MAG: DNA-directed RNA polymerase subunit D [Crenarchaeota archaeon]|nr:DNA-directed RNA polymerase subunit D [Thermoproteota archaeon]MDW8033938.1 DNA-directed RNA polymerase subunit D [Nitrososphaerota archaeon]